MQMAGATQSGNTPTDDDDFSILWGRRCHGYSDFGALGRERTGRFCFILSDRLRTVQHPGLQ
jgi:hypothetical protein